MTSPNDNTATELRPWRQILFYGVMLGLFLACALAYSGLRRMTHPVIIWVDADTTAEWMAVVSVQGEAMVDGGKMLRGGWERGPFAGYRSERVAITGLVLFTPPKQMETIERITIRLGEIHTILFDRARFQSEWAPWHGERPNDVPADWEGRVFQTPLQPEGSVIPLCARAINYEGDATFVRYVFTSPLFIIFAFAFALVVLSRCWASARLVHALAAVDDDGPVSEWSWGWLLAGLIVLGAAAALVEQRQPYYFTQDDNFSQFLPNMLYGCETANAGALPTWNPHQYLGAPLAEVGTYALTYPGTYLAHGIAVHLLSDRNATLEVFCWLHLALGYVVLYRLGLTLGVAAPLASGFALCQVLSGYALVCGRSWYYMTPVYLWAPLLLVLLLHARSRAPTWRWTLSTGLVIGFFFHAGNAQMWIYALGLSGLLVAWQVVNRSMPWQRVVQMIPAGLVGLGVAAVLLVPQMEATRDLHRAGGEGWDIHQGLLAIFIPRPMPVDMTYEDWPPDDPALFYAGTVFSLAWLAGFLVAALRRGNDWRFLRDPWNGLAMLTLLLALGDLGLLWTAQAQLPVLKQLNHPMKFLPFFHIFSCAAGAVLLNRAVRLLPGPTLAQTAAFATVAALLVYNAFLCDRAFFHFGDVPYPALPPTFAALQRDDTRILPLTVLRSESQGYVMGMQHNLPTVYGISSMVGYDPLVERDPYYRDVFWDLFIKPRRTIQTQGVTHLVLHREYEEAIQRRDWAWKPGRWPIASLPTLVADCAKKTPDMEAGAVRVYAVEGSRPLAALTSKPQQSIAIKSVPAGIDVALPKLPRDDEMVLNYLWRPGIRVYVDGVLTACSADEDQHVRVPLRAGTAELRLRYESPWSTGLAAAAVLIGLGLGGSFVVRRR